MTELLVCVPGIITPAADRYRPLLDVLGDEARAVVQDLQVYLRPGPPRFDLEDEVAAVLRAADEAGAERFHYLGYSAGAAVGLALAAAHPDRLLSLVVDEPPTDWSAEDLAGPYWNAMRAALDGGEDVLPRFAALQLADGVEVPPPAGPPPPWMASRPGGITAVARATRDAPAWAADRSRLRSPVLWLGGDLSHPHYAEVRDRLAHALPQLRSHVFPGTHHLASAGVLRPQEYADVLREVWRAPDRGLASPP